MILYDYRKSNSEASLAFDYITNNEMHILRHKCL